MNQSLIERGLMLLGALLILLFALGFVVPAIGAWQSEIRIMVVVGGCTLCGLQFLDPN